MQAIVLSFELLSKLVQLRVCFYNIHNVFFHFWAFLIAFSFFPHTVLSVFRHFCFIHQTFSSFYRHFHSLHSLVKNFHSFVGGFYRFFDIFNFFQTFSFIPYKKNSFIPHVHSSIASHRDIPQVHSCQVHFASTLHMYFFHSSHSFVLIHHIKLIHVFAEGSFLVSLVRRF